MPEGLKLSVPQACAAKASVLVLSFAAALQTADPDPPVLGVARERPVTSSEI